MTKGHRAKEPQSETVAHEEPSTGETVAREDAGEALGDQLRSAEEEARGHYDKLLRVMAEFDNFKKRMHKEREELVRFGNDKLLSELLPALDDLDRVLDHVPMDAGEEVKVFADGIALARKSLGTTLEKFGLASVAALGEPFDPARHEAIAAVESENPSGTVIAVHRNGYILHERLLRPAMVTVAK